MPDDRLLACRARLTATAALLALLSTLLIAVGPSDATAAEPAPQRKLTAWIPNWDQPRAMRSFTENADLYGYVSPFWYVMNPDGTVGRYAGAEDAQVLAGVRATGVPLVPTITNAFDPVRTSAVLRDPVARAAHVLAVLRLVQAQDYDGIDVDYESMAAADRDVFSTFLRELAAPLHAQGKLLTVAVHPKTAEPGTWSGPQSHDHAAIGAVADRVRVMAYGYSWSTSPAGPIAPLAWVRALMAYTTSVVPAAKVELGMNLYGRDWVGSSGAALTYDEVRGVLASSGATRQWDPVTGEPSFGYVADGAAHEVHYADAQSVEQRLAVVDELGLAGAAFWRLGGEDPGIWPPLRRRWATPPPQPASTAPPVVTAARGTLAWSASTGASGYRVLRSASPRGPWLAVADVRGTRHRDAGLPRGRRAWYAVQAVDADGRTGAASAPVRLAAR